MQSEPKTRRGRESRDRIVECAAELIAERGIERVGLGDVLAAAGAGKGQLYHYFPDRDALIEAAVARRCGEVEESIGQLFGDLATLDDLERQLRKFVAIYEQTLTGCPIGTLASEVAGRHAAAERRVRMAFDSWQELFADLFRRLRADGALRPDADPDVLATALLAALEGGQVLSQTRADASSLRAAINAALDYIRSFTA